VTLRSNLSILAVLAIVAFATSGCSRTAPEKEQSAAPSPPLPEDVQSVAGVMTPVTDASPASGGTEEDALVAGGRLGVTGEFVPLVRSDLVPRTGGRVARILADEGERVRRGQPLLELETDYLTLDLARAEAEKARALAAADEARRDLQRKTELVGKGSVSEAVFLRSKAGAEQAEAALAGAEAALGLAQQRLSDSVLTSPVDGVVAERRTDVGERLGEASVAFVVEQTAPLKLRFRVPERYLATVHVGQPVAATVDPYPAETFDGTVSLVGGSVDTASRTFLVEARFPNGDGRLLPGLFARVLLQLGEE
jgi:membrane fusion protein (multidrug efflux system)